MDQKIAEKMIAEIVAEVELRMSRTETFKNSFRPTVALVSTHVVAPDKLLKKMRDTFGDEVEYLGWGLERSSLPGVMLVSGQEEEKLLDKAAHAENVVLIAPMLSLLQNVAAGEDKSFLENLVIRSLLWGKQVVLLLDFVPPKFKRNTFYEKVVTVIETLEDMDVKVLSYSCVENKKQALYTLVTEAEVTDAYKKEIKALQCSPDAIVTALAKDRAKELGIVINH